ncbi:type III secretion system export apparatus subunit SctT [Chitinimonas sp. PSY-7]|uniref:type III secretion system export apparatus subunit SctT n=1 Tax=Chitinimonas sp. PSY-7 TaxID=3459088 RepID=UPI00403FFC5A
MEELTRWLPLLGVAIMRPLGVMLLLPLFNPATLGGSLIRNTLALMATLPVLPLLLPMTVPDPVNASGTYIMLLTSELVVGLLLGFSAAIPFWAVDMAGFVLDTLRGASMAGVFNPLAGGQSSPLGAFFSQLLTVLFLVLGGFRALLDALFHSYTLLPPGESWQWSTQFIPFLAREWQTLYTLALGFAMPALVMMVLVDLALGLLNRSVQQLNVFSLSMPIKSVIVLLMLIISLPFGFSDVIHRFVNFDGGLVQMLEPKR